MTARAFALSAGVVYALVGAIGFVPGLLSPPPLDAPPISMHHNYGYLVGMFPVNTLHSGLHLLIGAWGVIASRTWTAATTFAASLAIFYGLLAIAGLVPGLNTTFGLIPLWGHDVWLHALTAVVSAYFVWGVRRSVATA